MKYALISDIHANLPALEAVLADIDRREDVDAVYHLGDLVGYAPWPNEVVEVLRRRGAPGLRATMIQRPPRTIRIAGADMMTRARRCSAISATNGRAHVSTETKRALRGLPFRVELRSLGGHASGPTLILVHGNPILNTVYWTEDRPDSFCLKMAEAAGAKAGDVIAFGHTHKPWRRTVEGIRFVNTGSVGRPKDGDWRAGYVLLGLGDGDPGGEFVRVDYDIERAMQAIRESDLPDDFAE